MVVSEWHRRSSKCPHSCSHRAIGERKKNKTSERNLRSEQQKVEIWDISLTEVNHALNFEQEDKINISRILIKARRSETTLESEIEALKLKIEAEPERIGKTIANVNSFHEKTLEENYADRPLIADIALSIARGRIFRKCAIEDSHL